VHEYEKHGAASEKGDAAKSLEAWTDENWQTWKMRKRAPEDGSTKRYLEKRGTC